MKKSYLITIKGNDIFVYDCTTEVSSMEELLFKVESILNNLSSCLIEQLHIESIILL